MGPHGLYDKFCNGNAQWAYPQSLFRNLSRHTNSFPSAPWDISFCTFNACSMRALGMEPKAQCKGRRHACTSYSLNSPKLESYKTYFLSSKNFQAPTPNARTTKMCAKS